LAVTIKENLFKKNILNKYCVRIVWRSKETGYYR